MTDLGERTADEDLRASIKSCFHLHSFFLSTHSSQIQILIMSSSKASQIAPTLKLRQPVHLGVFAEMWVRHILPLFSYSQLKNFQQVNKVARDLTINESLAPALFRSDVNPSLLSKIKTVTLLKVE